jgi:hypothetical protein
MNNYQAGHCHYFAARIYSILQEHKVKCKYCVIYGHTVDNDDVHTLETLNHCYVKVGKFYYDSRGMNSIGDIKEREDSMMKSLSNDDEFYYTVRKHTNKINEIYFTQEPILPLDYNELDKDVNEFIDRYKLIPVENV